jgi:hypothetical protein
MVGLMKRIAKLQHDMPRNEDLLAIRAALERLLVTRLSPFDIERHGLPVAIRIRCHVQTSRPAFQGAPDGVRMSPRPWGRSLSA